MTAPPDRSFDGPPLVRPPAAAPRADFGPSSGRRRLMRVGPIAACLATVATLAATGIPSRGQSLEDERVPTVLRAGLAGIDTMHGAAPFDLGPGLGAFEFDESMAWSERKDGTVAVGISLRRVTDADAKLTGKLVLRGGAPIETFDRQAFVAHGTWLPDLDPLAPIEIGDGHGGATGFDALVGTLTGSGALDGLELAVRLAPDTLVFRGPWSATDTVPPIEAAFARVQWFRESRAVATEHEVPEAGAGVLAFALHDQR